ncbi:MAG: hypothetical protein ACAI35_21520 [Candidatus Methylacidiphilales bacterium]
MHVAAALLKQEDTFFHEFAVQIATTPAFLQTGVAGVVVFGYGLAKATYFALDKITDNLGY